MEQKDIILYSRTRCPLCVEAKDVLDLVCETMGLTYKEIDIHSDEALLEKYQLMIPVVEVDGEEVMYGRVTYSELKRCLESRLG